MNIQEEINKMQTPISQNAIARALGISPAAVTKYKKMGMPVYSENAARAWRQNNVKPTAHGMLADSGNRPRHQTIPSAELLHAQEMMQIATNALEAGQSINALVPTLRLALAAVPISERGVYKFLSWQVMDVLTAAVFSLLNDDNPMTNDDHPIYTRELSAKEAQTMAEFWYSVAAGEYIPVAPFLGVPKC